MLEELCKRIQHCCATLRWSRNKRNVGSCWLNSLTGFKLCATTSNNMQQGVQTDATCNIQQCCVRLHAALYLNKLSRLYAEFRLTAENRNHAGNLLSLRTWKFQRLLELISVCLSTCVTFVYASFYIAFAEWKWYKHPWDNRNSSYRYFKLISNRRSPSSKSNKWTIIISVYFFNIWHKYS